MIGFIKKFLRKGTAPLVHLEGNKKVTRIQWIGDVDQHPNTLHDGFSLINWEIHSDRIQFFDRGRDLGWGYLGDIAGPTVDIRRKGPQWYDHPVTAADPFNDGDLFESAEQIRPEEPIPEYVRKLPVVPVVVIRGADGIQELHFEYGSVVENAICIYRTQKRYKIKTDTKIQILMPDGKEATGWICDESGQTVTIKRDVKIMALLRDKKGAPVLDADGNLQEVEVGINWSGRMGKAMTNDKLSQLWATATSSKEKLMFGALMCFVGIFIGGVILPI